MRASQLQEATIEQMDVIHQKQAEADKALYVQFNYEPHLDQAETAKQGRPIYREREYIMIMVPGDKDSIIHRPVMDAERMRFAERYERWKSKAGNDVAQGTPLKMVPWLNSAQVRELEFFNCFTLEALANMSDTHAQKFMGIQALRQRARDAVQAAKDAAPLQTMRAEMDAKDAQLAAQAQAIKELGERLAMLEKGNEEPA